MEKKIITFGGITNVPDDGLNEAGDMAVLMNMRHKGGELVPCQRPAETPQLNVDKALYHANSGCWILLANGNLEAKKADYSKVLVWAREKYVTSFALMGNIVIINFADGVEYAIWRNGEYEYLGGLPEVPRMTIETTRRPVKVSTAPNKYYRYLNTAIENGKNAELWNNYVRKGYLDKCLNTLYESAAFVDLANFRLAIKLFDGTFISLSPVYVVNGTHNTSSNTEPAGGLKNFRWTFPMGTTDETLEYTAAVEGFIPKFTLEEYDFTKWGDIVSSICLFTTGSIPLYGVGKGTQFYSGGSIISRDYEDYVPLTSEEFKKKIVDSQYYKIAEFDLKGELVFSLNNTSPSNLAQQEVLTVTNIHQNKGADAFVMNSRLHINDIDTLFFPGFNDLTAFGENTNRFNAKKIVVKTYINTQNGDFTVLAENENVDMNVSALLTYPDSRAYKMDVYIGHQNTLYYKSFDLAKDESGTFAYYIDSKAWDLRKIEIETSVAYGITVINEKGLLNKYKNETSVTFTYNSNGYWVANSEKVDMPKYFNILGNPSANDKFTVKITQTNPVTVIPLTNFNSTSGNTPDKVLDAALVWEGNSLQDFTVDNKTIKDNVKNILKVSAVDNPFYFPTAQTYKFEGDIVGLASNAEAISTGQFGQYPLFVFTDTGIWAMGVDTSGQDAYTTQSPFSREVCNGAICPVSGGVVFSTDKGVMVISGGQVADLSAALDGFEVDFFEENAGLWEDIFAKAGKDTVVNPVPIREYIKGAVIAYNYHYNEIIVSNKALFEEGAAPYSYVYSLTNKVWSVIDVVFDLTTNKYPELVVFDKGDGKMYTFEDGAALNKVVAITRPFTLGSFDLKRLRQAGLRCTFEGCLNFYLLGSNDGAEFKCITGKEVNTDNLDEGTYRDLITAMSRSKQYKYFAIAIAGDMSGRVSMAELLVDAGFANNKLR